jgi:hypothetical protein
MVTWLALKVAFLSMCSHMTFGSNFISCTAAETMGIQKTLSILDTPNYLCHPSAHLPVAHNA